MKVKDCIGLFVEKGFITKTFECTSYNQSLKSHRVNDIDGQQAAGAGRLPCSNLVLEEID